MTTTTRTEAVAAKVGAALKAEGYTNTDVAGIINRTNSQVSRLLNAKSDFTFAHLTAIGRVLNINPTEFLGLEKTAEDNFLTVGEAAAFAHRHPETIRKAVTSGLLQSLQRVPGGWHLIRESDLRSWMAGAR